MNLSQPYNHQKMNCVVKSIFLLIGLLFSNCDFAFAQAELLEGGAGGYTGYKKLPNKRLYLKGNTRQPCFVQSAVPPIYGALARDTSTINDGVNSFRCMLGMHNLDSSTFSFDGRLMFGKPHPSGSTYFLYKLAKNASCNKCFTAPWIQAGATHSSRDEYALDSALTVGPHPAPLYPGIFIDTSWNHFTLFLNMTSPLRDSAAVIMKNIVPSPNYRPYIATTINRWKAYNNINSPEPTNKQVIFAAKNKPLTYNFGIVDKEKDSINVIPLWTTCSKDYSVFHPNFLCQQSFSQQFIKQAFTDSSYSLPYQPGYSPAQPFGNNANYTLNNKTGEISFIPQDTGIYLLAYTIEEYRDGQLLGSIMNTRWAYVIDSAATLPSLSDYYQLTPGIANHVPSQTITICPGQQFSYSVKATSTLAGAQIVLSTNAGLSSPNILTFITGQGTDSATITYVWTPQAQDAGLHYIYTDAVDTACGPGHLPVHQSKGVTIQVVNNLKIAASAAANCGGDTVTLSATGGWQYSWSVLSGDPYLPCTNCSELEVHPNVTTRYVLTGVSEVCGTRRDTFTLRYIPNYTVNAGKDTSFPGAIPPNYFLYAAVTPIAGYYRFAWTPASKVNNALWQNPQPINTVNHNLYAVTVTDSFNCFTRKDTVLVRANALRVQDVNAQPEVMLYPNPTDGSFTFESTRSGWLSISNIEGKVISNYQVKEGINNFRVPEGCTSGVYIASFREPQSGQQIKLKLLLR